MQLCSQTARFFTPSSLPPAPWPDLDAPPLSPISLPLSLLTSDQDGAGEIAAELERRGWYPEFLLDEGLPIYTDVVGMDRPVALIGTSEKGYLTVRVKVEMDHNGAGHSSRPPRG